MIEDENNLDEVDITLERMDKLYQSENPKNVYNLQPLSNLKLDLELKKSILLLIKKMILCTNFSSVWKRTSMKALLLMCHLCFLITAITAAILSPEIISNKFKIFIFLSKIVILNLTMVIFWRISKETLIKELNKNHLTMYNLGKFLLKEENGKNPYFNFYLNKDNLSIRIKSKPKFKNTLNNCLLLRPIKEEENKSLIKNKKEEKEKIIPYHLKENSETNIINYVVNVNMIYDSESLLYKSFIPPESNILFESISLFNETQMRKGLLKLFQEFVIPGFVANYLYMTMAEDDIISTTKSSIIQFIIMLMLAAIANRFHYKIKENLDWFINNLNEKNISETKQYIYKSNASLIIFGLTQKGANLEEEVLKKKIESIIYSRNYSLDNDIE